MRRCLLVSAIVFLALPWVTHADTEVAGQSPGGAYYRILAPDEWNGDLVIWNHGLSLNPPSPIPDLGPLGDVFLLEGTAIAASSYSQLGWAVFATDRDLEEMMAVFNNTIGIPDRIFLTGGSLGGAVTASALERAQLGNVVGALTLCGAMAGSRNWDAALDMRLVYDAVCQDVPGGAIPGGAKGLPKNHGWSRSAVDAAVDACTGILTPAGQRTRAQKKNLKKITKVTKLPKSFLITDMKYVTFVMHDLVYDRGKLRGKLGTGNRNVDYKNRKINAEIDRVKSRKVAARRLKKNFTPTGQVRGAKIVSIHTDKDGLVVVENQNEYAKVVPAENLTVAVVREATPSHCEFEPAEILAAWAALRDWVDGSPQPTATDIQATCQSFVPMFGGRCRFDPNFRVPDMDTRVRPRRPTLP